MDGNDELMSNHIINGGDKLKILISFLFACMVNHGQSPRGIAMGTMVPHGKGKWSNTSLSENYRAITLGSILGKILDIIILRKEKV